MHSRGPQRALSLPPPHLDHILTVEHHIAMTSKPSAKLDFSYPAAADVLRETGPVESYSRQRLHEAAMASTATRRDRWTTAPGINDGLVAQQRRAAIGVSLRLTGRTVR
jgi:hypothetical protein